MTARTKMLTLLLFAGFLYISVPAGAAGDGSNKALGLSLSFADA